MIKESTSSTTFYLTRKEIENLYWYVKTHFCEDMFECRVTATGIADTKEIRVSNKEETKYNITDYSVW